MELRKKWGSNNVRRKGELVIVTYNCNVTKYNAIKMIVGILPGRYYTVQITH